MLEGGVLGYSTFRNMGITYAERTIWNEPLQCGLIILVKWSGKWQQNGQGISWQLSIIHTPGTDGVKLTPLELGFYQMKWKQSRFAVRLITPFDKLWD